MKKIHGLELTKDFKQDVDWHCSHEPQFLFPALDSSKVRSLHGSPVSIALFFSSAVATWRLPEWLLCRMVGVQGQGVDFQSFLLNVKTSGELQGVYFQSLAFSVFSFNRADVRCIYGARMGREREVWNCWSL